MIDHQVDGLQDRGYRFLAALLWDEEARTHEALEKLAADRDEALQLLGSAEMWLRDVLLFQYGDSGQRDTRPEVGRDSTTVPRAGSGRCEEHRR